MSCGVRSLRGGIVFAWVILLTLAAPVPEGAAQIAWDRTSPFQGCLAADLDEWLRVQVQILTSEDPASWRADDRTVAKWTVDALASCKAKAGGSDEAAEKRFMKYMAHWRENVQDAVDHLRQGDKRD